MLVPIFFGDLGLCCVKDGCSVADPGRPVGPCPVAAWGPVPQHRGSGTHRLPGGAETGVRKLGLGARAV